MNSEKNILTFKYENMYPKPTDKLFHDSPDSDDPSCICSRCLEKIKNPCPVRVFVDDGKGGEYRFCDECLGVTKTNLKTIIQNEFEKT